MVIATPMLAQTLPSTQVAAPSTPVDLDPSRLLAEQVMTASRQLTDVTSDQDTRDAAARRLLAIGTAEARSAVNAALRDPASNAGRLAAARAIADDRPPDPEFKDALFVLLAAETPRPLLEAAAVALGNFKTEPDVSTRLVALTANGRPDVVRLAAIRALSTQIEKSAAQRLVELAQDSSPAISIAAGEALETFSSLPLSAPADWVNWWRQQADQTDERFRLEVLTARATRFEQVARHGEETFQELRRKVILELSAAPREQRGEVLLRYLSSPREAFRLIAIRQAYDFALTADLPASCKPAVRALLSDPNDEVRFDAARTMQALNDPDAFAPLAQQLAIEPDTRVRAELAKAMGPIGNLEAVPLLKWLLDDSSTAVVQAAITSLAKLGPAMYQADPSGASELAARFLAILQSRHADATVNPKLRETLVEALVPLRQRSMRRTFGTMLADPSESDSIRRLSAMGLGAIGGAEMGNVLVDAMTDRSPAVRIEAVRGLGKVSDNFVYAEALYRALDPKNESEESVRNASWETLKGLLHFAPREQLASWPDREQIKSSPQRRLAIFSVLAEKAAAAVAAGNPSVHDEWTLYLQQVGDTQMALGNFADATAAYDRALTITRQSGGPSMRIVTLTELTMRSMLQGRDYAAAARFANNLMRDPSFQSLVGAEFRLEAERLAADSRFDDSLRLITEALAMQPALPAQYQDQLRDVQRTIQRRQAERNDFAFPSFFEAYAMR